MGIDVICRSYTRDGVGCLCSGNYSQNRELVCDRGKQTMSIWRDLGTDIRQVSAPYDEKGQTDIIQFEIKKFACPTNVFSLFPCLSFYLSIQLRVVWRMVLSELRSFSRLESGVLVCVTEVRRNMQTCLSKNLVLLSFFAFRGSSFS